MATETLPAQHTRRPSLLDRTLSPSLISVEQLIFGIILVLSVVAHLWALDVKAMHHDESIHAWMSWKFFTGQGGFNCGFTPEGGTPRTSQVYCYDPVYHGPSLYVSTLVMYFLFGFGDAQARLPMALAGIGLVASSWMLRPYFGRRGMLIAAALMAFSPSLLYYTRFARHDGLMVLWTFWVVLGMFRYVDTGRPGYLYLMATGLALAVATHELYYILLFIFGLFLIVRLVSELAPPRTTQLALLGGFLFTAAVLLIKAMAGDAIGERGLIGILRGPSLLLFTGLFVALPAVRLWDNSPVVWERLKSLWFEQRHVLFITLAVYSSIYVLLYSTFFAYPRGVLDGAYAGLAYWLFTQHEYARGDQPWYYYLMLLPLYEPLALIVALITSLAMFVRAIPWPQRSGSSDALGIVPPSSRSTPKSPEPVADESTEDAAAGEQSDGWDGERDAVRLGELADKAKADLPKQERRETINLRELAKAKKAVPAFPQIVVPVAAQPVERPAMFPLFLSFWFFTSVVAFSWAGEKMPWLLVHMSLPGNLLAAWALGRMLDGVNWSALKDRRVWLVPPLLTLLLIALGVALWRLGGDTAGVEGQARLLQGIIPLLVVGATIYALLTLVSIAGQRAVLALCGATLAVLLSTYMLRASWLVNYEHPDVPIEPLVYVQTAPDVPLIVDQLTEMSIAQTRNNRTETDETGGNSMPVIMDTELAWPLEWYMRDFTAIQRQTGSFFQNLTSGNLQVGDQLAPVVMVYKPNLSASGRAALEQSYVLKYDTVLNWWFPEGDKCRPQSPGYKRFYFNSGTSESVLRAEAPVGCGASAPPREELHGPLAPLLYPFQRDTWPGLGPYLLFRTLPGDIELQGREMEVWVRSDLAGGGGVAGSVGTPGLVKLVADRAIGTLGSANGQFNEPRGATVDAEGNLYVADTFNHRIQVFDENGTFVRSIGSFGTGDGQLYEPRGVAVDADGNVYVADTWNARVAKFDRQGRFIKAWGQGKADFGDGKRATQTDGTREGNAAEPLGFFGPRGIAVDPAGNVYLADTGNKRVVVTDSEGTFKYQWGYAGALPGAFDEPTSLAIDAAGNVYVADSWNGRVQIFSPQGGQVGAEPSSTWQVPGWQPSTYLDPMLAVSPNGQVFVSVPSDNAVIWAENGGQQRLRWGGAGSDTASLNQPSGLAVAPDGTLYVVDRANNRILHFRLPQ